MKTRFKFLTYGLLALAITITSCEKEGAQGPIGPAGAMGEQGIAGPIGPAGEDGEALGVPGPQGTQGETGPAGPQGVPGPQGAQGEPGAAGAAGADGNANVITSAWIPITFETNFFGTIFEIDKNEFPANVRDDYAILVYVRGLNFADALYPLPITVGDSTFEYILLSDNTLRVFFKAAAGSTETAPSDASLRYVLLESTSSSGKSGSRDLLQEMQESGVDISNHDAVMEYLGLDY